MDSTLQKLTENKNIILVGNSVEIMQYDFGKYIDSFDTVVRFGKGVPDNFNNQHIGKRTDIWITGWLRMNFYKAFKNVHPLFNRCRINLDKYPHHKGPPPWGHDNDMFSDEELKKIFKLVGAENNTWGGGRPSAGFLGILFFLTKCKCESVTLIGFDFFAKKLPVKTGGDYPSSWHMPCNLSKDNPHNPKEKDIVKKWEKEGKLKWKILSDLETEMLKFS
jgi:hypothetical protein